MPRDRIRNPRSSTTVESAWGCTDAIYGPDTQAWCTDKRSHNMKRITKVVRRAVQGFELGTEAEAAELRELVDMFNQLHPETLRIADESHRKVAEILTGSSRRGPTERRRKGTAAA